MAAADVAKNRSNGRRGAAVALVAVTGTVMMGFVALSIDVGTMYVAQVELQRTADAAALAGASMYFTDVGLGGNSFSMVTAAWQRSDAMARSNTILSRSPHLASADVSLGQYDLAAMPATLGSGKPWNAARVRVCRTTGSENGPIPLFFAGLWGRTSTDMAAAACAALDDRMSGYRLDGNDTGTGFLPFAIPEEGYYDLLLKHGKDNYSFNGAVSQASDQVPELVMYPWKWKSAGGIMGEVGTGNFGTLNIGQSSNGSPTVVAQINGGGIRPSGLISTFGTTTLTFYDDTHTAATGPNIYWVNGDPGLSATFQTALQGQIGNVFGFFLQRGMEGTGNGTRFAISGIFYARIMAVDLNGGSNMLGLIVQPVGHTDAWVVTSPGAPSTSRTLGRIRLVQ